MRHVLVVVDMQNDFIDGTLGTKEAEAVVERACEKIRTYAPEDIFVTMDTHGASYKESLEGRMLPVEHCIKGTHGWELHEAVREAVRDARIYEKDGFGSERLARDLQEIAHGEPLSIEMIGLCTDICVVTNALLLRALLPGTEITVDGTLCAGTSPALHRAALDTMRSCQIRIETA